MAPTLRRAMTPDSPPGQPVAAIEPTDTKHVNRDGVPVIAAQALLANCTDDALTLAYLKRTWRLDEIDAQAALAAARVLVHREHRPRTIPPNET